MSPICQPFGRHASFADVGRTLALGARVTATLGFTAERRKGATRGHVGATSRRRLSPRTLVKQGGFCQNPFVSAAPDSCSSPAFSAKPQRVLDPLGGFPRGSQNVGPGAAWGGKRSRRGQRAQSYPKPRGHGILRDPVPR